MYRSTGIELLYLSFTKLEHPSFFQPFQFSSVLRMCCQKGTFKVLLEYV